MEYESPEFVRILRHFAYYGAAGIIVLEFFFSPIPLRYVPKEMVLYLGAGVIAWVMFWLSISHILDAVSRSAYHLERIDFRNPDDRPKQRLEF